jgi:hypothetical protein
MRSALGICHKRGQRVYVISSEAVLTALNVIVFANAAEPHNSVAWRTRHYSTLLISFAQGRGCHKGQPYISNKFANFFYFLHRAC